MDIIQGSLPSLTVGGRTFTDLTNLQLLLIQCSFAKYSTFRTPAGTPYQVPVGKNFRALCIQVNSSAGSGRSTLGYDTTDRGIDNASLTSPAYMGGSAVASQLNFSTSWTEFTHLLNFLIPATRYPFIYADVGSGYVSCKLFGYEESV